MIKRKVIYSESQDTFFRDVLTNQVAAKMRTNLEQMTGATVTPSEYRAWQNSPGSIKNMLELSGVKDTHVSFEYFLPYTQQRVDCMLYGKSAQNKPYVFHIELKQWDAVTPTHIEGNMVETYVGKGQRIVPHPSQQVKGYHNYLVNFVEIFEQDTTGLFGCAYCHNYTRVEGEGLHDPIYTDLIAQYPVFAGNEIEDLSARVREFLGGGQGYEVFNTFMRSPVQPSKKLLENASKIVANESSFALINDQIVARNVIISKIKRADRENEKSVIVVKGGPGTGKTVIALHILAEIAGSKKQRKVFFSTKSKPLLEGIKNRLGRSEAKMLFTNLTQYIPAKVEENDVDLLIVDEAHRIGKTPNHQYMKSFERTDLAQVATLIRAAKTSVFFIDDKQVIRSAEIGSTELIKQYAKEYGCTLEEVELVSQFRCNGSDNYLDWVESVLGHSDEKRILTPQDHYEFKLFDDPQVMYDALVEKNSQPGATARIVAGFCWPWSKTLDREGNLVKDVKIGDFAMPWETHSEITKPPKGYVKWYEWAYLPGGIKQVGCIYTAQGFEFDYIGVIIGKDVRYDRLNDRLVGDLSGTKDPTLRKGKENFDAYVRNIYRVLMTRGMKGCYVYCVDEEVRAYLASRVQGGGR